MKFFEEPKHDDPERTYLHKNFTYWSLPDKPSCGFSVDKIYYWDYYWIMCLKPKYIAIEINPQFGISDNITIIKL